MTKQQHLARKAAARKAANRKNKARQTASRMAACHNTFSNMASGGNPKPLFADRWDIKDPFTPEAQTGRALMEIAHLYVQQEFPSNKVQEPLGSLCSPEGKEVFTFFPGLKMREPNNIAGVIVGISRYNIGLMQVAQGVVCMVQEHEGSLTQQMCDTAEGFVKMELFASVNPFI